MILSRLLGWLRGIAAVTPAITLSVYGRPTSRNSKEVDMYLCNGTGFTSKIIQETCKGCPECKPTPRLRFCQICGIVTMGARKAYCRGIVMHYKHNPRLTQWVDEAAGYPMLKASEYR